MKVWATIVLGGGLGCAEGGGGRADPRAGCEAELAMKNEKISLLELVLERQHELLEVFRKKEKLGEESVPGGSPEAREERIRALRWQLERAASQLVRMETQVRTALEDQRRLYESQVEGLRTRVAELEKERAGKN